MKGTRASAMRVSQRAAASFLLGGMLAGGAFMTPSAYRATAQAAPPVPTTPAPVPAPVPAPAPITTAVPITTSAPRADADLLRLPDDRPIRGMSWPALSPDGRTLCFVYLGDLWTVGISGGVAQRLTVHEALDAYPRWSPDGKFIAFTSTRTGNADIFLVPAQGGSARQVTFNATADWVSDWSPDGTKLLFYSVRDTRTFSLFTLDLHTRAVKKISNDEEPLRYAAWGPDGKTVAFTRAGQPWWRPWYRGSVAASTVVEDLSTGKVRTLVKTNTQQLWPLYAGDGKSVYVTMIYGSGNTPNLWRVPLEGGSPVAITKYTTDAVRYPAVARSGNEIAYIYNGDLYTAREGGQNAQKVTIVCRSDDKVNNQQRAVVNGGASEIELSPDGKQLALVIQGDIWLMPTSGGDAKRLTDDPANDDDITWSPDGTKLAFISDRGNQPDLYTLDVKTKAITRLTNDVDAESNTQWSPDGKWISFARAGSQPGLYVAPASGGAPARLLAAGNGNNNFGQGVTSHAWSPDSRWVAFARMDRYTTTDIWVVPAVGGSAINVTRYPNANLSPRFTRDGRNLLFVSTRDGAGLYRLPLEREDDAPVDDSAPKPKPVDRSKDVKIDFEDIQDRAKLVLAGPPADYAPTPDSQRVIVANGLGFVSVGIKGGPATPLAIGETGGNIKFVPDGSRFFYTGANGTPRSLGAQPGPPQSPQVVTFNADLLFDRRVLYQQAFNEFYRKFGTSFYDAKMHGVNWPSLRAKYEPLLQGVGTPEEFANLLSEMVGEVNSSHSEINPATRPTGPQPATLGVFYDDTYTGPGLKVTSVMPKGPADLPTTRLAAGDYILALNGTEVTLNEAYYEAMQDKAGKVVDLLVNSRPSKDGARTIKVKAISTTEWSNLEYEARVKRNRALVDKLSNGRLAYIHIRNMDQPSLARFERELYSDALNKDGLVLDIRGNGGGNTHDRILEDLSRHVYGYTQPRDGQRQMQPERAFTKSVVLLINQNSYSDAEIFPAGFRDLKLGKIVGVATPGYVIGTYSGRLIDGTTYRLPMWGWYTAAGKNMENLGIPPDITVENRPEDIVAGRDRQLETAVETLLKSTPATGGDVADGGSGNGGSVISSANLNPNGGSSAGHGSKSAAPGTPVQP